MSHQPAPLVNFTVPVNPSVTPASTKVLTGQQWRGKMNLRAISVGLGSWGEGVATVPLYLVVHHRGADQPWQNSWLDDDLLEAIQTTAEIGRLCARAQESDEQVFVHRCGWAGGPPLICCAVRVGRVSQLSGRHAFVEFVGQVSLECSPPLQPGRGQNWYESEPL
jgi:hypothetical protein